MKTGNHMKLTSISLVVIMAASAALFLFRGMLDEEKVMKTSDAMEIVAEFDIGMDGWIGYMPLCSDMLKNRLRVRGIALRCHSDDGNYPDRMKKLKEGTLNIAVSTVDANLLTGAPEGFPGVIVSVIDQSKGGDACVAWKDKIGSIDELGLKTGWKVAFTPNSPSHQLIRSIGNDFGIQTLLTSGDWRVETNGAEEALAHFLKKDVDVACLWQPYVASALKEKGVSMIHSSANADKVIVDILMARRELLAPGNKDITHLKTLLSEYFTVLRKMKEDKALMVRQAQQFLRRYAGMHKVSDREVHTMLNGVEWINLRDNAENWFGVGGKTPYYGLESAHDFALSIIRAEKGKKFLPYFRPAAIIQNDLIKSLYLDGGYEGEAGHTVTNPLERRFSLLSESQWDGLQQVGTLRSRPVIFKSGTTELGDRAKRAIAEAMQDLKRYPDFRVELRIGYLSHGDIEKAQARARARAESIRDYLIDTFKIDPNRLRVFVPDDKDLGRMIPRKVGESTRAYNARFRQVQFVLKTTPR